MRLSPTSSALLWDLHNVLYEITERSDDPFVRVRYEDLVERPAAIVAEVTALHGVPAGAPATELGHSISGNPMRFDRGPVQVRVDDEWIEAMTTRDRRLVTTLTAPFLAR